MVVVGAGPAGLFAAWQLAEHGAKVVLIERGKPVETRARDFGLFRGRAILNPESNICFGEGGAGTYSDGKLTCRTKDPLRRLVLERLVEVGAPARILVDAKPHIGTNLLFGVLKNLRARLLDRGVDIRFQTRVERLVVQDGRITGVETTAGRIDATRVVLATGHSARDTYEALLSQGVPMEAKPFAVGVRAEHPQALIDEAQYNLRGPRPDTLPPADYRLAHTTDAGRGVYSFCMCPGGMIVPTATEPEMVVVNGMSSARRSGPFANSGVVAQVELADLVREGFGEGPLAGVEFQRALERKAFEAGGRDYKAPAMLASDLAAGRFRPVLAPTRFRPGLVPEDLRNVLPGFVVGSLQQALQRFDKMLRGYASAEANLIAVESRTSSPVRIPRDPNTREVPGFSGLFVAGEGPGYAGGIMSAALDGLHTGHAVLLALNATT
ncbi:MAG: FAD-dependent oxidoreductase [Deltaproteobacteria bacterium]|nr:FAD-dependent oxidoreductase [Deltaproteobacteria bacterium]